MDTIRFDIDLGKRKQAVEALRRYSPKQKVLVFLIIVAVVWMIASVFVFNRQFSNDMHHITKAFFVGLMVFLCAGIPLIILISLRSGLVDGVITARENEMMLLSDSGIEYGFSYKSYGAATEMTFEEYSFTAIPYTSITRIELYEDVQALKVYGTVYICDRPGAPTEESIRKVIDDPDKAYRVFFLYYHDADKLVQLISDRSGKPVTRLQHCTGSLQEVK